MRLFLLVALLPSAALADAVWLTDVGANKIQVIKEVRAATGLGLKDAKDLVEKKPPVMVKAGLVATEADALIAKLKAVGAKAEMRPDELAMDAAGTPPAAPPAGEATWGVRLESFADKKINCIKVVRDATGLGLKETKELVEMAPTVVKKNLSKADAEKLAKQLNDAGGRATAILAAQ